MPDLLTHVLVGYVFATLLSIRVRWLTPEYVTVVMLGAIVPDLTKAKMVVASRPIELWSGLPFDWFGIHTLGGVLLAAAIGSLLTTQHRRRIFVLVLASSISHLFLDGLLVQPSGFFSALLFPFTTYLPPTPELFLSSDRWPAFVTAVLALIVWFYRHRYLSLEPRHH
jgi:hypothetical protein